MWQTEEPDRKNLHYRPMLVSLPKTMELPEGNKNYKQQSYWDERYEKEENYDWFTSYHSFRHLVMKTVRCQDRLLMLGCGNSKQSADMYTDGITKITNMDYSPVVIEAMSKKYKAMSKMTWDVMDMTKMTYPPDSFDVVMEKGTIDSLLVEEKSVWTISQESQDMLHTVLTMVSSLLPSGGRFISITFADPFFRKAIYARPEYQWDITVHRFGTEFHFYYLEMTKGQMLSESDLLLRDDFERRHTDPEIPPRPGPSSESEDEDYLLNIGDFQY